MKPINQAGEATAWEVSTETSGGHVMIKDENKCFSVACIYGPFTKRAEISKEQAFERADKIVRAVNLLDALTVVEESARNLINIMGWVPDGIHDEKHALKSALSKLSELKKSLNLP